MLYPGQDNEDPEDSWTRENRRDEMELERKEEDEDEAE